MANIFDSISLKKLNRNNFNLSHDVKLTFQMGQLVPTCCIDCVPGDRFTVGCESMVRFQPTVAPVMHRFNTTVHYFFVPYRLLWENFDKYITNTRLEGTGVLPAFPTIEVGTGAGEYSSLCDYMGIPDPAEQTFNINISALPFAAYQFIVNEYYRAQYLQDPITYKLIDGSNNANRAALIAQRNRGWGHDYLTSALPFAQAGQAVDIPLGDVQLKDTLGQPGLFVDASTHEAPVPGGDIKTTATGEVQIESTTDIEGVYDPNGTLEVTPTTVTDLRRAMKLQEWLERAARAGSRYTENLLAFFGVRAQDSRLQRPEYITGIKAPIQISEVLNTTGTENAPQGAMAGHGIGVTSGKYGKYFAQEHGCIIGIMSVLPEPAYQNGIPRMFLKINDPFEFYWPQFAHIGEQPVYNAEVYAGGGADPMDSWAYNPRYSEYKFENNRVAGEMRESLDFWHAGRKFANLPALNETFVEMQQEEIERIFAVQGENDALVAHVFNRIHANRQMPKFGNPML